MPMARSRTDGRPSLRAFSSITASARRTDSMSIGKKNLMMNQPTTRSTATIGHAASVHSRKVKPWPLDSRSMPMASGARPPPRRVAMPPICVPQAIAMNSARP